MSNQQIRSLILDEITHIQPFDELEERHLEDARTWIRSGADIFRIKKPDVPLKHLVSYFVLVDPKHKSILLVDHIKAQLWLPTGGHVELNEDPRTTVERESVEELGKPASFMNNRQPLFLTMTQTVGLTPGHTDVSLWYVLRGDIHEFVNYDRSEFNDVEWFSCKEILESDSVIFDPHMQRFVQKLEQILPTL